MDGTEKCTREGRGGKESKVVDERARVVVYVYVRGEREGKLELLWDTQGWEVGWGG